MDRATICYTAGPRQSERSLMADVDQLLDQLGEEALSQPVLIVVPSNSLREHLLTRLAVRHGRAIAGLTCMTLHGLARDLVQRAGGAVPTGIDSFSLFARRFARREAPLRRSLDGLVDGYGAILGSVRDLLDAGLEPAHEEALLDALETEGTESASPVEVDRVKSLVRVAARTAESMTDHGLGRRSTLLSTATDLLKDPAAPGPTPGALLVYGFADATGLATDFIVALLERYSGRIYLDRPPDPTAPEQPDPGVVFGRRFEERIQITARGDETPVEPAEPATVEMRRALGGEAEVREVARQIRHLIDQGVPPETIGVVSRGLDPYISSLRIHFSRLGVPFSGVAVHGPHSADGRRIRALLDLVLLAGRAPLERWLDTRVSDIGGVSGFDIRLALFALGLARLEEVRDFELDRLPDSERFQLPVRQGFVEEEGQDEDPPAVRAQRRSIPTAALQTAIESASLVAERLEGGAATASVSDHTDRLRALLIDGLGWSPTDDLTLRVLYRLERQLGDLPPDLQLDGDEHALLLEESLGEVGRTELGGQGGGVQVMDVTQARSRTFEHLFLLGLNRGDFPRTVREDPVFPDSLRRLLGREGYGVLPDLPVKRSGYDEERFLFAQLLAAAPRVTLSWQETDNDNKVRTPSPLVERLRWSQRGQHLDRWSEPPRLRHLFSAPDIEEAPAGSLNLRPAFENAVLVALHGSRRELAPVMPMALAEAETMWGEATEDTSPETLAAARLRILAELDPQRGRKEGEQIYHSLGPYFGFVGPPQATRDPRRAGELYITTLEKMASCPWQAFLARLLRLEPLPDPLAALPAIDPRYIGSLVHKVAERIVQWQFPSSPSSLEQLDRQAAEKVSWPDEKMLKRLVDEEAVRLVRKEGIGLPGYAEILAEIAIPHLEVLRRLESESGESGVRTLAAEIEGRYELTDTEGRPRPISFRADRVDLDGEQIVVTDYKTGRVSNKKYLASKKEATREGHFVDALREGSLLQAPLYALATSSGEGKGRFLFLDPDFEHPDERRVLAVGADNRKVIETFEQTARTAVAAWDQGAFFPRLQRPDKEDEPTACGFCQFAEACLRGDSGARGRLSLWAGTHADETPKSKGFGKALTALLDLWYLPAKEGGRS
ncbi:MAG: PD-(D/E)XK nuclease family protein [Acidobacteria bacterium]|nr:MAG: PD-(D/E)XK nuclease family protein [Acidobacteriota bacterium]